MCRSIKTLFNFEPPATDEEVRAAALQFVRKLSGFNSPSQANRAAFDRAVDEVAASARGLIAALVTTADPRDREIEAQRARARSAARFGSAPHGPGAQCPRATARRTPGFNPQRLDAADAPGAREAVRSLSWSPTQSFSRAFAMITTPAGFDPAPTSFSMTTPSPTFRA
jgi:hypothetical protein